jgi:excisionase family DNA binding protein
MDSAPVAVTVTIADTEMDALENRIAERILERLQEAVSSSWINIDQAADYLAWTKKRLYNLVSQGEIPHRKQGGRLLFNRAELDRWLDLHYQGPEEFTP